MVHIVQNVILIPVTRFAAQKWFHKTYEEFLADNFLNEDMTKITAVAEYTEEQFQEVKTAMKSLGYPETNQVSH